MEGPYGEGGEMGWGDGEGQALSVTAYTGLGAHYQALYYCCCGGLQPCTPTATGIHLLSQEELG